MKKLVLFFILIFSSNILFAQLTAPESITYSTYNYTYFISDAGSGKIYTSEDGVSDYEVFTEGLTQPKGIFNDYDFYLWVADVTNLVQIDIETGEIINTIPITGSQFLNDVVVNAYGDVLLTDTQKGIIFKYNQFDETVTELSSGEISAPNGIAYDEMYGDFYVVTFDAKGSIYKINDEGNVTLVKETGIAQLDGISFNNDMTLAFLSSWSTNAVYTVDITQDENFDYVFGVPEMLQGNLQSPADIYYNKFFEELGVPLMNKGEVEMIKFAPKPSKPNDLEYDPASGYLYVSNFDTPKILFTSDLNDIENANYQLFDILENPVTSIEIIGNYLYAASGTNVYKYDINSRELIEGLDNERFVDDISVVNEDVVLALTEYFGVNIIDFSTDELTEEENEDWSAMTSDADYAYFYGLGDTTYFLEKIDLETGESVIQEDMGKIIVQKLEMINDEVYAACIDSETLDYFILKYDPETLKMNQKILIDEPSFAYGVTRVDDYIYYTVPYLNKIGKLQDISSVRNIKYDTIEIYPNPAIGKINTGFELFDYKIINMDGVVVNKGYNLGNEIELTGLNAGAYILVIEKDGKNYLSKFIKK